MSLFTTNFLLGLLVAALFVFFITKRNERRALQTIDKCANLLQEIFKMMGESSSVTRVLAQESLDQELVRLKYLL